MKLLFQLCFGTAAMIFLLQTTDYNTKMDEALEERRARYREGDSRD